MEQKTVENITNIFHKHMNDKILVSNVPKNPLLSEIEVFDNNCLSYAISHIWSDIFCLYGWNKISTCRYVNMEKKYVVEIRNTFQTLNNSAKERQLRELSYMKSKFPGYTVAFGAIVDKRPVDYYDTNNTRIITGYHLLIFMLGGDYRKRHELLETLTNTFIKEELKPFLKNLYKNE